MFCEHNDHLWAACCFLFVDRFACVGPFYSGDFARQAENCQTIGLDKSARYLSNVRCASIFIVILFFAFFTSQSRFTIPVIISRYNASQSPVNCAGNVCLSYYVTHCLYCNAQPTTSANRSTVNPSLGYHTGACNIL